MTSTDSTSWSVIEGAAKGDEEDRRTFARVYSPVLRAYLQARWKGGPFEQEIDDAVQEVFIDCYREGGVLARVDPTLPHKFRAYLYEVTRRVAVHLESRRRRIREDGVPGEALDARAADQERLSKAFDGAWARAILLEALELARAEGGAKARRVELLRQRIYEERPIRDIAREWGEAPEKLHHEYARARTEFVAALKTTLSMHSASGAPVTDREVAELMTLLA